MCDNKAFPLLFGSRILTFIAIIVAFALALVIAKLLVIVLLVGIAVAFVRDWLRPKHDDWEGPVE